MTAMMTLHVKLFAGFRIGRFKEKYLEFPQGKTLGDVVRELSIAQDEVGVIMCNGRHAERTQILVDGDSVGIFPLVGGG